MGFISKKKKEETNEPVASEIGQRLHEELGHAAVVFVPLVPLHSLVLWEEIGIHERGSCQEEILDVVRHPRPERIVERVDGRVQDVRVGRHVVVDHHFNHLIAR